MSEIETCTYPSCQNSGSVDSDSPFKAHLSITGGTYFRCRTWYKNSIVCASVGWHNGSQTHLTNISTQLLNKILLRTKFLVLFILFILFVVSLMVYWVFLHPIYHQKRQKQEESMPKFWNALLCYYFCCVNVLIYTYKFLERSEIKDYYFCNKCYIKIDGCTCSIAESNFFGKTRYALCIDFNTLFTYNEINGTKFYSFLYLTLHCMTFCNFIAF